MKFLALVSGGKDSCFNILHCLKQGHELIALGNLYPSSDKNEGNSDSDEIDSFMYQTVGFGVLNYYSEAIGVPMYRRPILGKSLDQNLEYKKTENDETEDLYLLLKDIIAKHPDVEGVSVGAILSSYQRTRVENVCFRLGLTTLSYLWQRDQEELLSEMITSNIDAILIKVAAIGLNETHLGKGLRTMEPILHKLNRLYEVHVCGEGGEYETIVLDAPFFKKKLVIVDKEIIKHSSDDVYYLKIKVELKEKNTHLESDSTIVPKLLNDEYEETYDTLINKLSIRPDNLQTTNSTFDLKIQPVIDLVGSKLYISNLSSSADTLEEQVNNVFSQLKKYLSDNKLSINHITHISLFLSSMNDFLKVNSIYTTFFTKPLPPSRVCVETTLPLSARLMLSAIATTDLLQRKGLHVQGRSYWAPANIGPYSQAIIDIEGLMTISGQIPLVPQTMIPFENKNDKTQLVMQNILSLKHFDTILKVLKYDQLLSTIAFITDLNALNIAKDTMALIHPNELDSFFIVLVKKLPKNVAIEWSGYSGKNYYSGYETDSDSDDEVHLQNSTIITDLTNIFEDSTTLNSKIRIRKYNDNYTLTTTLPSISYLEKIIQLREKWNFHITVYTSFEIYETLAKYSQSKIEVIPVLQIWDLKGDKILFGIVISGKLTRDTK